MDDLFHQTGAIHRFASVKEDIALAQFGEFNLDRVRNEVSSQSDGSVGLSCTDYCSTNYKQASDLIEVSEIPGLTMFEGTGYVTIGLEELRFPLFSCYCCNLIPNGSGQFDKLDDHVTINFNEQSFYNLKLNVEVHKLQLPSDNLGHIQLGCIFFKFNNNTTLIT